MKLAKKRSSKLFHKYFEEWIATYKKGAVAEITLNKYMVAHKWIKELAPDLRLIDLDRGAYQKLINDYAETHEKQTTVDFHHVIGACVKDAVYEGLIDKDPTYRAVMKGKPEGKKKPKFLNKDELGKLIRNLELGETPNTDWFFFLLAKTGLRFAEGLGLTPSDIDLENRLINVNKTWNYKTGGGFRPTKNKSSMRAVPIDWQTTQMLGHLTRNLPKDKPIFVPEGKMIYNATFNERLGRLCREIEIPEISIHGLRHTHGSVLLASGASILSVSKRLGHSNITTTQEVYLHITKELDAKDNELMMQQLASLA